MPHPAPGTPKQPLPPRRSPERTCVSCRKSSQKRELVRVVRSPEGEVAVDPTLRAAGRGAYLCKDVACLEQARKRRALERALKVELDDTTYDALRGAIGEPGAQVAGNTDASQKSES